MSLLDFDILIFVSSDNVLPIFAFLIFSFVSLDIGIFLFHADLPFNFSLKSFLVSLLCPIPRLLGFEYVLPLFQGILPNPDFPIFSLDSLLNLPRASPVSSLRFAHFSSSTTFHKLL